MAQAGSGAGSAAGVYRIAGTVVNGMTGEPLRRATVAVLSEADSHTVESEQSDNDGHFKLTGLAAAKYQLTASKRGFRTAFYDEHDEYSTAIVTGEGQETTGLTFRMMPGAVLHGEVTADGGDPVEGARVMLFLRPRLHRLGERINQADATTTDDTGAYEFGNLAAEDYLIAVTAEPWYSLHRSGGSGPKQAKEAVAALDVAYPVTFFDSTTDEASATAIALAAGANEEAKISLHAVPALHLFVQTPIKANGSIARPELRQSIFGSQVSAESMGLFDAMQTGRVEFNGVAPGHYELAQGEPPRILDLDATANQQVEADAGTPTVGVSGTVRTGSGSPVPDEVTVNLMWLDGARGQDPMQTQARKGHFNFEAVPPGSWALSAFTSGPGGSGRPLAVVSTAVGSTVHAGSQVMVKDRPVSLVVTVSESDARIEGFARKAGKGFAGAMIVLVPRELAGCRALCRRDQSDSDGSFSLRNVAPGQYKVVAIEDGWELDWSRPEVIARYLPKGVAVTVTDPPAKSMSLTEPVPVEGR